jgi:MFS family permease
MAGRQSRNVAPPIDAPDPNPSAPGGRFRRLVEFLGLRRSIVALLAMVVLVGLGERMAERFLPIYLIALGAGLQMPGVLNAMDNLLSALYSFPGGYLSDRLGHKRALLIFNLVALLGYAIVIVVPSLWAVFLGSVFFLSWSAFSLPATMSLVADVLPENKRAMGVSLHSMVRRIPMALGPIAGGLLIDSFGTRTGVRLAFVAALVLGLISIVVQQLFIAEPVSKVGAAAESSPRKAIAAMSGPLKVLLVSDILIRFAEQLPYAYVVIWCMQNVGVSGFEFGVLTAVEMITAFLIYIPVAYFADRGAKKPFVLMTFAFFAAFPVALLFSGSFPLLVLAFVLRGLKEFGEPTRKALILDLSPAGGKAGAFGAYYLARDVVVALGALSAGYLWAISPRVNLLVATACGVAGTAVFAVFGRGKVEGKTPRGSRTGQQGREGQ